MKYMVCKEAMKKDCVETMISTAFTYKGKRYVIGETGALGTGIDCSG